MEATITTANHIEKSYNLISIKTIVGNASILAHKIKLFCNALNPFTWFNDFANIKIDLNEFDNKK